MSPSRWRQIEALYHAALERESSEQAAFLKEACAGDPELSREVESLLAQGDALLLDRSQYEGLNESPDSACTELEAGAMLGPYEIVAPIGEGGMGMVYKARDTRLDRTVAVKISKEQFSERFEREALAIAALNHPHICQLYDVGPYYLVMEYVEGAPLKGPLPVEKAVEYASQILDALHAAHQKALTHRDLKPANVLVTRHGIKLLDFGLAKHTAPAKGSGKAVSETLTSEGQIVGTPQYMAPEQLQGLDADARSDLFAFGCILYELISGKRAFDGKNPSAVFASILEREPPPLDVAPELSGVIARCLDKDPEQRFQDALDLKTALVWAVEKHPAPAAKPARWLWALVAAALAITAWGVAWMVARSRQVLLSQQIVRFQITPPEGGRFDQSSFAMSPDGRMLAFVATVKGKRGLWVRPLDGTSPRPLEGTEGASQPFWSPDAKHVGYFAGGKLWRIDLLGGAPLSICEVANGVRSGNWGSDGTIVFGAMPHVLSRVSASGGPPAPLTSISNPHVGTGHLWPQLLPGGAIMFYVVAARPEETGVYAARLDRPGEAVRLIDAAGNAVFAAGHLLWLRGSTLVAQRFDPDRLQLTGEPRPVADPVAGGILGHMSLAASAGGVLVYGTAEDTQQLTWFDRAGTSLGSIRPAGVFYSFALSPDGQRVLVHKRQGSSFGLWTVDVGRDVWSRFTFAPGNGYPVWSRDGRSVIFRGTAYNLFRADSGGSEAGERITESGNPQVSTDWSRNGKFLMYYELAKDTDRDIWILPVTPDGRPEAGAKPRPFLRTPFSEQSGKFSPEPNPHWVAYMSNESGLAEVYVQAFPEPKSKWLISKGGGQYPAWSPDGRELFYVSPDFKLMAVKLKLGSDSVQPSAPNVLLDLAEDGSTTGSSPFAVAPDGKRFLVRVPAGTARPLEVIVNWPGILSERSGTE